MSKPHGPSQKATANGPRAKATPTRRPVRLRRAITADRVGRVEGKIQARFNAHFHEGTGSGSRRADRVARHLAKVRAIQDRHEARTPATPRRDGHYDPKTGGWYTGD